MLSKGLKQYCCKAVFGQCLLGIPLNIHSVFCAFTLLLVHFIILAAAASLHLLYLHGLNYISSCM